MRSGLVNKDRIVEHNCDIKDDIRKTKMVAWTFKLRLMSPLKNRKSY